MDEGKLHDCRYRWFGVMLLGRVVEATYLDWDGPKESDVACVHSPDQRPNGFPYDHTSTVLQ